MGNFIIAFGLFVTTVIFIVFSIFGIEYNGKEQGGGGIFLLPVLFFEITSIAYIFFYEMRHHKIARGRFWPYYLPFAFLICYFLEYTFGWIKPGRTSEMVIKDVVAVTSVGMWAGTYCYRYNKLMEVLKNIEVVTLFCTFAMILALPTMFLSSIASIGGAGDHQIISYTSALAFGMTICRLYFKPDFGYAFFRSKFYYYLLYPLMLVQGLLCVVGGGRGGIVLLIAIFVVVCFFQRKNLSHILTIVVGVIVVAFILNFIISNNIDSGVERALSIFEKKAEDMDNNRNRIYSAAFNYFLDSPFLGYGFFRSFDMVFDIEEVPYWHNIFMEWLIQGGVILFIFGCRSLFLFFIKFYRLIKQDLKYSMFIPVAAYPLIMLLFSGSYLLSPVFWFALVFILGTPVKKIIR